MRMHVPPRFPRGVAGLATCALLLGAVGCDSPAAIEDARIEEALLTQETSAKLQGRTVTRWVELMLQAVRDEGIGTAGAGRLYAMVTVAMFDAVNGIDAAQGIGRTPAIVPSDGAPKGARRDAAAAAAAHAVLVLRAPGQAGVLDAALADDIAAFGGRPPVVAGLQWGAFVGQEVFAARETDGAQSALIIPAGSGPGVHRAEFDSRYRNMTPFGIAAKEPYATPGPPALSSAEYAAAFEDVKTFGVQDGDAERNEISDFWLAPGGTVTETGTWIQAGLAIVRDQGTERSISHTARFFALLGMSIADAVIVSWDAKAKYFSWRPTVAIHEADTDGNPATVADPGWTSRIGSVGGSPEHTSGTSTFAGAASMVIERFYGADLDFCFVTDRASNGPRCFSSPLEGAEEAGRSRIYQGIHFMFSDQEGRAEGRGLGVEIMDNMLKPVHPVVAGGS